MIRREPPAVRIAEDLLRVLFFGVVLFVAVFSVMSVPPTSPPWLAVLRRIVAGLGSEILCLALLRLMIPKPRSGSHLVGFNSSYLGWQVSTVFAEVAMHPVLRAPFWFLYATRFIYLRALGANIAWGVSLPPDLRFRSPSLVTIERGAQVEPGVTFENAIHAAGRVHVEPIGIGGGTLIGAHSTLMPGASIGHDARVGPGVYIGAHARVGVSAAVGEHAVIAEGVDVGSYAKIGPGSVLSKGVIIADRARVLPGTVVPEDVQIGEREVWEGPAPRRSQPPRPATS
jgi:acetyltransferase-like isoleucine patch superfamily enzyme